MKNKFQVIYCDPPWDYKGQKQHAGKGKSDSGGATSHYGTVTTKELMKLDVPSICDDDCLIYMWVTSPHLDQGIELMKAWGFKYATIGFIWDKKRVNPGFYTMSQCEICIIGKKGKIPQPRGARNVRQFIAKERTKHSEKPIEVMHRITKMFPTQNKIELFARKASMKGWSFWGNEVECDIELKFKDK
jgi:N6-adenosine-specific RNA methylase IME4